MRVLAGELAVTEFELAAKLRRLLNTGVSFDIFRIDSGSMIACWFKLPALRAWYPDFFLPERRFEIPVVGRGILPMTFKFWAYSLIFSGGLCWISCSPRDIHLRSVTCLVAARNFSSLRNSIGSVRPLLTPSTSDSKNSRGTCLRSTILRAWFTAKLGISDSIARSLNLCKSFKLKYFSVWFRSNILLNACKTEMSIKLYARSTNLRLLFSIASAVKIEFNPVLQIKFQARCSSSRRHLSSSRRSATA